MATELIPWSEKYATGLKEIDDQHKKLLKLLNDLYQAFIDGDKIAGVQHVLEGLLDYTKYHFDTEERYFYLYKYPEADEHIAKHKEFIAKVLDLKSDFQVGRGHVTYQLMNFLRDWLLTHIMEADQKYVTLLRENGVK